MSQKTTVKKDEIGLYVVAGGWICRPIHGTCFKENDKVKSHHFGGSTKAGVTILESNFKKGPYEYWSTTGIFAYKREESIEEEMEKIEWYTKHGTLPINLGIGKDKNKQFAITIGKEYISWPC